MTQLRAFGRGNTAFALALEDQVSGGSFCSSLKVRIQRLSFVLLIGFKEKELRMYRDRDVIGELKCVKYGKKQGGMKSNKWKGLRRRRMYIRVHKIEQSGNGE